MLDCMRDHTFACAYLVVVIGIVLAFMFIRTLVLRRCYANDFFPMLTSLIAKF